jgi:hypothetical protein
VSIFDNVFLTDEKRDEFIKSGEFSENEAQARIYGRPEVFGGVAIPNFDTKAHVIPAFQIPSDWQIICSADPHHLRPAAFLWIAYNSGADIYYVFQEWPTEPNFHKLRSGGKTPAEYATLIRNIEGRRPAHCRVVDPRFGQAEHQRHGYRETSWREQMLEFDLDFDPRIRNTGSIDYGLQKIQERLHYDKDFPVGPNNTPRLFIFDCCQNLINSLLNLGFTDAEDSTKGLHRKLSEEYKDFADALRYALLYDLPVSSEHVERLQVYKPEDLNDGDVYDAV